MTIKNIINFYKKEKKFVKYGAIGITSVITSIILLSVVLNIADYTSNFGDKFRSQKLFIIKKEFNIRKGQNTSSSTLTGLMTKVGQIYVIKDVVSFGRWVKVDPVYKDVTDHEKSRIIKEFPDRAAYIHLMAGEVIYPFERNIKMMEKPEGQYSLGPFLTFFTARINIKYVYWVMALFLIVFNYYIFKRLIYLWFNHKSQREIENIIFDKELEIEEGIGTLSHKNTSIIPAKFISAIHNSFKLEGSNKSFEKIYKDFQENERESTYSFTEDLRVCNIWIIRSGIFGTLVGLIIAFFELYIGMGDVKPEEGQVITNIFIQQIQQAILGNALAVATSITAHGIALVMEVFIGTSIKKEDNVNWLEGAYTKLLSFEEYKPVPTTTQAIMSKVDVSFKSMIREVNKISEELEFFTPIAKDGRDLFEEMNMNIANLNSSMRELGHSVNNAKQVTNEFSNEYDGLSNSTKSFVEKIDEAQVKVEELNTKTNAFYQYLSENVRGMRQKSTNLLDNIRTALGALGEKLINMKNSLNDSEDDE